MYLHLFQNVLLAEVKERVVIFIGEIDSTLSLPTIHGQPFTDDFYQELLFLIEQILRLEKRNRRKK